MAGQTDLTPSEHADKLGSVLDALATKVDAFQATIATGVIGTFVADRKYQIAQLMTRIGDTGSGGQTDVDLHVNGASILNADLVTDNADADGIRKTSVDFLDADATDLDVGDLVEIVVAVAPTSGTDLAAQVKLLPQFD